VLARATPPDIEAGRQYTNTITCEFYDVCSQPLPGERIRNLPGTSDAKPADLKALGVESIGDIPQDFSLTERQKRASECVRTGRTWFGKGLKEALADLQYLRYFMGFENPGLALPRFAGMRPYDLIPFQWSVHVQRKPGAEPPHIEAGNHVGDG